MVEHVTVVMGQAGNTCSDGRTGQYPSAGYIFRALLTSISINRWFVFWFQLLFIGCFWYSSESGGKYIANMVTKLPPIKYHEVPPDIQHSKSVIFKWEIL